MDERYHILSFETSLVERKIFVDRKHNFPKKVNVAKMHFWGRFQSFEIKTNFYVKKRS